MVAFKQLTFIFVRYHTYTTQMNQRVDGVLFQPFTANERSVCTVVNNVGLSVSTIESNCEMFFGEIDISYR